MQRRPNLSAPATLTAARLRQCLPATLAHTRLALQNNRPAAVLVPLEPEHGVWLTRRGMTLPNHAGQVAFPGGKIDPSDASAEQAALREAHEEIGLPPGRVDILGRMDDYITGTGFHIVPVVGLVPKDVRFAPAPGEVQDVFCLPFETLLNPALPLPRQGMIRGHRVTFFVWPHADHIIWGATAEILRTLAQHLRGAA